MESRLKTSTLQFVTMVEYMEKYGDLSKLLLEGLDGRLRIQQRWTDLSNQLNSDTTGDPRDIQKWKKVWTDWKQKVKKKNISIRMSQRGTGGGPCQVRPLNDLEKRVLAIIGDIAAVGSDRVMEAGLPIQYRSSPVPLPSTSTESSDETGTKRISHRLVDSTGEESNYNRNIAFLEPQHESAETSIGETGEHSVELQEGGQTFFPSFANLFQSRHQPHGHSRPVFTQEGAYSQRPSPLRQLLNNFEVPSFGGFKSNDYVKAAAAQPSDSTGILGSGNFGVIPGGTFFSESSDLESQYPDSFNSHYNNGHGRPAFQYNNRPLYNEEQFANFRDFADINTPSSSAFSHYVVVYANKNATIDDVNENNSQTSHRHRLEDGPKNIIETLEQIDKEKQQTTELPLEEVVTKKLKLSKSKLKLSLLKDKYGKKIPVKKSKDSEKDLSDPMLALS